MVRALGIEEMEERVVERFTPNVKDAAIHLVAV